MPPTTHSDVLWSKIHLADQRLSAASDRFWNHPQLATLYPAFLIQLHHIVCGGLDLMSFAADRAASLTHDPSAVIAAAYMRHHIEEEQDHAGWLLRDIATLGIDAQQVHTTPPLPSVISLLGERYFWIAHSHPVAVFGYLIVLEGSPPLIHQLDQIQRRTQLPQDSFRCLRSHAEDDPAHLAELNRTLDSMSLSPSQTSRIALEAFATIDAVADLLDHLAANSAATPPSAPQPALVAADA